MTETTTILVAADARWVRDQVRTALVGAGREVVEVTRGQDVRDTFAEIEPDLVVLDMQIGNMGGIATALDLRLEESAGRLPPARLLLLLDREADRVVASRADADLELVKPVDAGTLRRAVKQLLAPPPEPEEAGTAEGAPEPDAPATESTDDEPAPA